jgi:hypothetical protein
MSLHLLETSEIKINTVFIFVSVFQKMFMTIKYTVHYRKPENIVA